MLARQGLIQQMNHTIQSLSHPCPPPPSHAAHRCEAVALPPLAAPRRRRPSPRLGAAEQRAPGAVAVVAAAVRGPRHLELVPLHGRLGLHDACKETKKSLLAFLPTLEGGRKITVNNAKSEERV